MTSAEPSRGAVGRRVVHVPMPFCVQGSTLITVTRELARCQAAVGGYPMAALSDNRGLQVPEAAGLLVDHTRYCKKEDFNRVELGVDIAAGMLGGRRPFWGRLHRPAVEAVRQSQADAVLLYEGHYAAASLPWWNELRPATKVVLYIHNPLSRSYGGPELRRLARSCDAMVFCADHLRQATVERLRGVDIPLEVIHNGIAADFLEAGALRDSMRPPDDAFELLLLGRTTPEKGAHVLLDALTLVRKRVPQQVRAVVIGSANYAAAELTDYEISLRKMAAEGGLDVEFVPHVDRATARDRMIRASAVCIPSLWAEGLPLVALEAMATGTPVVTLDSAGVAEACGEAALYAAGRDPAALADAIVTLITDPAKTQARVVAGRERALGFTWERAWGQFDALLDRL